MSLLVKGPNFGGSFPSNSCELCVPVRAEADASRAFLSANFALESDAIAREAISIQRSQQSPHYSRSCQGVSRGPVVANASPKLRPVSTIDLE